MVPRTESNEISLQKSSQVGRNDPAIGKARVMPGQERIQGREIVAQIFPKLLKKKNLQFIFEGNIKFAEKRVCLNGNDSR
jgi:hypothetical protein